MDEQTRRLSEALEREAATREILRVINRSPGDYQPVFRTILDNATRLCGAPFGLLYLLRGDHLHLVADVGARPEYVEHVRANPLAVNNPVAATSRAAKEREPRQIADLIDATSQSGDPVLVACPALDPGPPLCHGQWDALRH